MRERTALEFEPGWNPADYPPEIVQAYSTKRTST
jgi:hypothetical protein